jgi:hypothetical protein
MWVVVLAEVPRTRETLLLRLLGSGRVLREALADLAGLPEDAWEKSVATPILLHFRIGIDQAPATSPEDDVSAEIRAWYEQYQQNQQKLRNEARREGIHEGERKLLLRQLRARFGELPATAVARIEAASEAELGQWAERLLGAQTLAEVLGPPS